MNYHEILKKQVNEEEIFVDSKNGLYQYYEYIIIGNNIECSTKMSMDSTLNRICATI